MFYIFREKTNLLVWNWPKGIISCRPRLNVLDFDFGIFNTQNLNCLKYQKIKRTIPIVVLKTIRLYFVLVAYCYNGKGHWCYKGGQKPLPKPILLIKTNIYSLCSITNADNNMNNMTKQFIWYLSNNWLIAKHSITRLSSEKKLKLYELILRFKVQILENVLS